MESEKRLIDANEICKDCLARHTYNCTVCNIGTAPTVDAVVLPCKIGTQIWLTEWHCSGMRWTKLIESKPRNVHHFDITKDGVFAHFRDGCINVKYFGESVFLTKEEAKATLAKMDGDGNG